MHGHHYLITDVLKGELGFAGFVVSDWNGIDQIDADGYAERGAHRRSTPGIDMVMVPTDYAAASSTPLRTEVHAGRRHRWPASTTPYPRILTKKFELGLFERPLRRPAGSADVGTAAHRALARAGRRASQVLLKNAGDMLPLTGDDAKIFVAGQRRQHRPPERRLDHLLAGLRAGRSPRAPRSCRHPQDVAADPR